MKEKYYVLAALALGGAASMEAEAACRTGYTNANGTPVPQTICYPDGGGWTGGGWYGGGWDSSDCNSSDWQSNSQSDWGYDTLPTEPEKPDSCTKAGNPILVASGTKVEFENNFTGLEHFPLSILRSYSSSNTSTGAFGAGWISVFDKKLDLTTKTAFREDGQSLTLYEKMFDIPHVGWKTGWVSSS